jgi:hypothetical protein
MLCARPEPVSLRRPANVQVAASDMLKPTTTVPNYAGVPTTVLTLRELARVGLLEHFHFVRVGMTLGSRCE